MCRGPRTGQRPIALRGRSSEEAGPSWVSEWVMWGAGPKSRVSSAPKAHVARNVFLQSQVRYTMTSAEVSFDKPWAHPEAFDFLPRSPTLSLGRRRLCHIGLRSTPERKWNHIRSRKVGAATIILSYFQEYTALGNTQLNMDRSQNENEVNREAEANLPPYDCREVYPPEECPPPQIESYPPPEFDSMSQCADGEFFNQDSLHLGTACRCRHIQRTTPGSSTGRIERNSSVLCSASSATRNATGIL